MPDANRDPSFTPGDSMPDYLFTGFRETIFAEDISPIEKVYSLAFKKATASGEKTRGAHLLALQAVHLDGIELGEKRRPKLRQRVGGLLLKIGKELAR